MTGTVYGLGIGPGDPELITLKATRILQQVPVIAYPAPEVGDSLARQIVKPYLSGRQTEIIIRMPMVAARFPAQEVYDQAVIDISGHLHAGEDVAVLCEGDPFFYGSFMYLFGRLVDSFKVEVVPGVSSLTACATTLGAPLAARNDVLTVLPAPLDYIVLKQHVESVEAAAFIKVGRHFAKIRTLLEELNLLERARYIERATMAEQKSLPLEDVNVASVPYFSMILVHKRGIAWKV